MTISIKPTASGSTIEQDGSTVLSVESDRSVDIDSGTLHVDATNNRVGVGTSSPANPLDINLSLNEKVKITDGTQSIEFVVKDGQLDIGTPEAKALVLKTNDTERVRITDGGSLSVGTTSADGIITAEKNGGNVITAKQTASGGWVYKSNAFSNGGTYYHIEFLDGGVSHGSVTSNGTTTAYNTSSDYRLKDNVSPMSGSIDRLKQLKPSTWTWIQDGSHGEGFLAHEAQEVVPECATGTKDAVDDEGNPVYQGIDQSKLVPLLTAALQEAITKIEDLETRIQALELV